jgi:long-chain fatty acid transport protein
MIFPDAAAQANLRGDGWGWNVGLLYDITPDTRIGLSYRSTTKIDADGHTKLTDTPAALGLPGRVDASTSVKLPDTAILSLSHNLNEKWQLLADVSWTGWSSLKTLDIDNGPLGEDSLKLKFRDTWRVALGANYRMNPKWTLKAGVAWDQTPIRNENYRLTSLPDNDRIWASIGARYNFSEHGAIDIGYAHLFVKNTDINNTTDAAKGTVRGKYDSDADIFGVQVSYRF